MAENGWLQLKSIKSKTVNFFKGTQASYSIEGISWYKRGFSDCYHCHGQHFSVDQDDYLIWNCVALLRSPYARCSAWNVWLKMRLDKVTDEEDAVITLAVMCETPEQQLKVGIRLFRMRFQMKESNGS